MLAVIRTQVESPSIQCLQASELLAPDFPARRLAMIRAHMEIAIQCLQASELLAPRLPGQKDSGDKHPSEHP